jgi:metal-responsive CopG/Arc/MetJ family transcriptional regulator
MNETQMPFKVVGISIPEELHRRIQNVAADRLRNGETGGFSAALRILVRPELERLERKREAAHS